MTMNWFRKVLVLVCILVLSKTTIAEENTDKIAYLGDLENIKTYNEVLTNLYVLGKIQHGGDAHALGSHSFASGTATYANSRGWYFKAIDQNNKIIYLTESKLTNANQVVNVVAGKTASFYNSMNSKECIEVDTPEEQDFNKTLSKIWVETNVVISANYFPSWVSLVLEYHDDFSIVATSAVPGKIYYTGELKELARQFTTSMVNSQDALNQDYGVVKFLIEKSSSGSSIVPTSANVAGYLNNKGVVTNIKSYDANLTNGPAIVSIYSAVFGRNNFSLGNYDFVSGQFNVAYGDYSSVSGKRNAVGYMAHGEGMYNRGFGMYSHVEGYGNIAWGYESHAEGKNTVATGDNSHSAGYRTWATGKNSHSEGMQAIAKDLNSFVWSGNDGTSTEKTTNNWYYSHGAGTYNINPKGGLSGFYIGESTILFLLNQTYATKNDIQEAIAGIDITIPEDLATTNDIHTVKTNLIVYVDEKVAGIEIPTDIASTNDVNEIKERLDDIEAAAAELATTNQLNEAIANVNGKFTKYATTNDINNVKTNLIEYVDRQVASIHIDLPDDLATTNDVYAVSTNIQHKLTGYALKTDIVDEIFNATNNLVIPKKLATLSVEDNGYMTFADLVSAMTEGFELVEGTVTNRYKFVLKKIEE